MELDKEHKGGTCSFCETDLTKRPKEGTLVLMEYGKSIFKAIVGEWCNEDCFKHDMYEQLVEDEEKEKRKRFLM